MFLSQAQGCNCLLPHTLDVIQNSRCYEYNQDLPHDPMYMNCVGISGLPDSDPCVYMCVRLRECRGRTVKNKTPANAH